jgi:hypothetical protein
MGLTVKVRPRFIMWGFLVIEASFLVGIHAQGGRRTKMITKVDGIRLEFSVLRPQISRAREMETRVVFTNEGSHNLRLNGLFLDIPKVLLKVRRSDGTPVFPGPPGIPPLDDGETGRFVLRPGESKSYEYNGSQYFGTELDPGKYQVRFRYENTLPQRGDWTGTIETDWVDFEVKKPNLR